MCARVRVREREGVWPSLPLLALAVCGRCRLAAHREGPPTGWGDVMAREILVKNIQDVATLSSNLL